MIDPKILLAFLALLTKKRGEPIWTKLINAQVTLLLRYFVGERETRETVDQAQGTMGRRKRRRACFLPSAFLCAPFFFEFKRRGGEAADSGKFLGTLSCLDRVRTKTWTPFISSQ